MSSHQGRRVLITGGARGIGAALAERLTARGDRVSVIGLEPELLAQAKAEHWAECDVTDREAVEAAVASSVEALGGLDVVVANAGVAAQMPIVGGDPAVMEKTIAVNVMGVYYTLRAAGPHVSHPRGYALAVASVGAVVHLPLMGAYSASKAAVEALGNTMRIELRPYGAKVGVAYFAELDTDMTSRGFATKAAARMPLGGHGHLPVAPVEPAIDAIERGIRRRSRRVVSPSWVGALLPFRAVLQRVIELQARRGLGKTLEIARGEEPELTTPQPQRVSPQSAARRATRA